MRSSSSPLIDEIFATPVGASEEGVKIRLRLCLLRSGLVETYEGPDRFEEDAAQILDEYAAFAAETEGWELLEKSEKGVVAQQHHTAEAPVTAVTVALLGLDAWRLNLIRRDASIPHEPFMEMRIETSEEAEENGSLAKTAAQFVEHMTRYSGEPWGSADLPRLHNEDGETPDDAVLDQATVRPPSISSVLQRVIPSLDRPFIDTSSLTDWLLPEILLEYNDEDLGVAGTSPILDRPYKEGHFGVYALNQQPPPAKSPEEDPSEGLWDPSTKMGMLSDEELTLLRRRGLNEMVSAPGGEEQDDDDNPDPKKRRAKGRDFVEYKGREAEDLLQDGRSVDEDEDEEALTSPETG